MSKNLRKMVLLREFNFSFLYFFENWNEFLNFFVKNVNFEYFRIIFFEMLKINDFTYLTKEKI